MDKNLSANGGYRLPRSMGVWILLVSLLINCFLLGLVAAPVFHPHRPPPFMGPPGSMIEHMTEGLSSSDAAIVRDAFQQEEPTLDQSHFGMEKAMLEMTDVLQQPSVDPKDLQKALDGMAVAHAKMDEAMNRLITEVATSLSPEGRRHFALSILPPPMSHPGMHMHDHEGMLQGDRPPPD